MSEEIKKEAQNTNPQEKSNQENIENIGLSQSRTQMMCNHCLYTCNDYNEIKEHYKSEFHKYNLNRVTMNLAPLSYEEYIKRKELFMKKAEEKRRLQELQQKEEKTSLYCDICNKKFTSHKKMQEHLKSKNHNKNLKIKEKQAEENKKNPKNEEEIIKKPKEPIKTTLDDNSICLFCNIKSNDLKQNFIHMVNTHNLNIPFIFYIKSYEDLIKLLSKKIFTYKACLSCDTQKFTTFRSLQAHMLDKAHTFINYKDLDEFLYKYYDYEKISKIKDKQKKKTKEYKVIILRAKVAKELKEKDIEGNDEWEYVNDDLDDDFEPIEMPNGELMVEGGKILGNKMYNIYYKQRIRLRQFEDEYKDRYIINRRKHLEDKKRDLNRKQIRRNVHYKAIKGSFAGNFRFINKCVVKRPQMQLV